MCANETKADVLTAGDGGPAFPTTPVSHGYPADVGGDGTGSQPGMTLLDYFAAAALASQYVDNVTRPGGVAEQAYDVAQAMIAEKKRREALQA